MGNTKRQHYVPRSYLKRFSFDGKRLHTFIFKKDIPNVLTLDNQKQFLRDISLRDVCVSEDFYTIDESNPHNNNGIGSMTLEKDYFQDFVEPKLSSVINTFERLATKILTEKKRIASIPFSQTDKMDLALSTFIQYHRTPRQRSIIDAINNVVIQYNKEFKNEKCESIENIKGLDVAFTHADKTFLNMGLWSVFLQKISSYCLLLRVSDNGNFFTSDNPVVIHKLGAKGNDIFNVNFYQDDFNVFFPLTPNLILEYYCPIHFPQTINMNDTISVVDVIYENQVNKYQYINAEKFVFSQTNDFSLFLKPIN